MKTDIIENNYLNERAPTSQDGAPLYSRGSEWTYNGITYECTDATEGASIWVRESNKDKIQFQNIVCFSDASKSYFQFSGTTTQLLYRIAFDGDITRISLEFSGTGLKSNGTPDTATIAIYDTANGQLVGDITWDDNARTNYDFNLTSNTTGGPRFLELYGVTTGNKDRGRIHSMTIFGEK